MKNYCRMGLFGLSIVKTKKQPKFTDNELRAMKVLSKIYYEGVDWDSTGTHPAVKESLISLNKKLVHHHGDDVEELIQT